MKSLLCYQSTLRSSVGWGTALSSYLQVNMPGTTSPIHLTQFPLDPWGGCTHRVCWWEERISFKVLLSHSEFSVLSSGALSTTQAIPTPPLRPEDMTCFHFLFSHLSPPPIRLQCAPFTLLQGQKQPTLAHLVIPQTTSLRDAPPVLRAFRSVALQGHLLCVSHCPLGQGAFVL